MNIIPQNGNLLIEMIGPGDYTTKAGILLEAGGNEKPNIDEVVKFKVLAVDPNPRTSATVDTPFPYTVGQTVCAQGLNCKEIRKRNPEDRGEKQRFYIHWSNVIAVIEEEKEDVN